MSTYDAGSTQAMAQTDQPGQEIVTSGVDQARRYAALSGPFDPVLALRSIGQMGQIDPERLTAIAAGLSRTCDRSTAAGGDRWLMRGAERRRTLDALASSDQLSEAIAQRRGTADDQPTEDLLNAIDGAEIFSVDDVAAAVRDTPDRDRLERLVVGLGRAGPLAPQYERLPAVKAALTHLDFVAAAEAIQSQDFFGRDEELQQIISWLDSESAAGPSAAFYIEGLPGIGKTTLVEQVAARLLDVGDDWVVVRFDFDRAGLDIQDTVGLTLELARQVSAQLPGAEGPIQQARLKTAGTSPGTDGLKGNSPELVPEDLGLALANALASPRRRIFLVLDTLEVLRARGETHPGRLFDWIDQLASVAKVSIAVVGAGRGNALDKTRDRLSVRLPLSGLPDAGFYELLQSLDVDAGSHQLFRSIADGHPLTLRFAAKIATEHGVQELAKAGRSGLVSASLYRFLLSRIDDPDLQRLASQGLVVRRISADVIREVIAPQVGLGRLGQARADELFHALAAQDWLVEPDPAPGFLRHRSDIRAVSLPIVYESAPARSARIDRSAARWFGAREENWCQVEAAYHRLQLMRRDPAVPPIPPAIVAQLDAVTILELPTVAQDAVHRFQGDRSTSFRGDRVGPGTALDPDAAGELRAMNDRSDWLEANYVYERAFAGAVFDPDSAAADVALTFLWRSGRWSAARKLLDQQKGGWHRPALALQLTEDRLNAVCRLEMGAELDFDRSVRVFFEQTGIGRPVAELVSDPSLSGLVGAGLRFAVHRAEIPVKTRSIWDAAGTAIERWQFIGPNSPQPVDPTGAGWERITARIGPVDVGRADGSVVEARRLAVLTPFTDLVGTMRQLPEHQYLADYAAAVRERLNEIGNLAPIGSQPWRDYVDTAPTLALQSLTDLGLLAELIGAAAYLRRDRDLNLVARSAERWRRTTAGSWSYGTAARPTGWDRAIDVSIADRLTAIVVEPDAIDRAAAQLRAWCPERPREGDVLGLLRKRAPATIEAATRAAADGTVADAAAVLLRGNIPSAFVPGIAVLLGPSGRPYRDSSPSIHPVPARRRDTTMTNGNEEQRRQSAQARLDNSPELRAEIDKAIADGRLPAAVVPPRAADELDKGSPLESVVAIDALEAIVRRVGRPPLVIENDQITLEALPEFAAGTDALIKGVEPNVRSVGRVEFVNHSMAWGGTGWVIDAPDASTRVIATNRHVAKEVAARVADGSGVFLRSPVSGLRYGAEIDFKEEVNSNPGDARPVRVTGISYLADDSSADVALLRVTGDDLPSPLQLAESEAEAGLRVGLIGYPAYDPRNNRDDQARYFKDLYEVKRFAPGFVMQALKGPQALTHDCTSLGGNSGSPLISLEDGRVVGLHYSGLYGVANSAVGVGTLRKLLAGDRPLVVAVPKDPEDVRKRESTRDGSHPAGFFGGRKGYDPGFLGRKLKAPWPGIATALEQSLAQPSDAKKSQPFELRYTHFGVKYHQVRRQPLMTAVNINGEHPVKIKRTNDKWFFDERIPVEDQLTQADYDDPEIDRGHMVRREDPNWDTTATSIADPTELALLANADTFHYTNAALQHSRLNQGKQLWQGLENYILDSARTEGFKACVFTGPIFRVDDPELENGLAVPQEFWKLVVMLAAGGKKLHATAYLLSQGDLIRDLLEKRSRVEAVEGFVLGPYRTFQIAVADLADATGLDLDAYTAADPLGGELTEESVATREPVFVPLDSLDRIVA